jgi:hypothetical protein
MKLTNLKVFKVKDKETYNHLNTVLSGWCFFKNDGENYYIKAPKNNSIDNLIEMGLITELSQDS